MAPRPNWKGYLKLSLVSCAVALFTAASESGRISFRTLNRHTGNRLRRQMVDPETGEVVDTEDQAKGYEVARDEYIIMEDDELEAVQLESTHTIDIDAFVPREQVDELYLDTPYYLAPNDRVGQEAFAVIRDAMRESKMVGLGRVVLYRRERVVMLEPRDKGIVATTLRYANEVRNAADYFDDIPDLKLPKEMLQLAQHIIETKKSEFDPSQFEDRYEQALIELIRSKQAGHMPKPAPQPRREGNVIDLMAALRRSLEGGGAPARSEAAPARTEARRAKAAAKKTTPAKGKAAAKPAAKTRKRA